MIQFEDFDRIRDHIYEIRHDIHRHPEVSGKETRTAGIIRKELSETGIPWRNVEETGTFAHLEGAYPGPSIMLRADIDALPVQEKSRYPYPSEYPGYMHACGHDVHCSALLGAARLLAERRDELHGSVRFVFQQSEESGHGSQYFLRENVTDGVLRIYGFHVTPDAPLGSVLLTDGTDAASCDHMDIRLYGKSGHIASPDLANDALAAAADISVALRNLKSRIDPLDNVLIGIGRVSSGNTWNVISDYAELEGTVRFLSMQTREKILPLVEETVRHAAAAHGVKADVSFELNTPCLVNDKEAYKTMYEAALKVLKNDDRIIDKKVPLGFGGDDFAAFSRRIPGCFIHVGTAVEGESDTSLPLHSPDVVYDDRAIDIGCMILTQCALLHLTAS